MIQGCPDFKKPPSSVPQFWSQRPGRAEAEKTSEPAEVQSRCNLDPDQRPSQVPQEVPQKNGENLDYLEVLIEVFNINEG